MKPVSRTNVTELQYLVLLIQFGGRTVLRRTFNTMQ